MPKFQSSKVHLVTLRECPPSKSGRPYFKGRWGDATVLLFREDRPYRVENDRAYYDWNLVVANDYSVIRAYHEPAPHNGGDDLPEPDTSGGEDSDKSR